MHWFCQKTIIREALNTALIVLGILSAGLGLKGFLLSSHFIDGGVTGISMLLANVPGWPLSLLILAINLPFIALGYRQIGRAFAIRIDVDLFRCVENSRLSDTWRRGIHRSHHHV